MRKLAIGKILTLSVLDFGFEFAFPLVEKAGGFGNRAGVPDEMLLLLVHDRARFLRASAKFLSLPLLLFLVLLFWLENKVKSTTT